MSQEAPAPVADAEATAVEETAPDHEPVTALAVRETAGGQLAVTPQAKASELVARLDVISDAMKNAMTPGVDYGTVPGVSKPTLLKPGAEKLSVLFQLDLEPVNTKTWGPGDHLTVESVVTAFHAPTGARVGSGEGLCTTREKKYGKRRQDRECPECGASTIKRSKYPPRENPDDDPGWYCYAKIGGCGANFDAADERITGQAEGEVDNPDLPDAWNTVIKMAEKRARVACVLAVTGASALFTQDVEDSAAAAAAETAAELPAWVRFLEDEDDKKALIDGLVNLTGAEKVAVVGALGRMGKAWGGIPFPVKALVDTATSLSAASPPADETPQDGPPLNTSPDGEDDIPF